MEDRPYVHKARVPEAWSDLLCLNLRNYPLRLDRSVPIDSPDAFQGDRREIPVVLGASYYAASLVLSSDEQCYSLHAELRLGNGPTLCRRPILWIGMPEITLYDFDNFVTLAMEWQP